MSRDLSFRVGQLDRAISPSWTVLQGDVRDAAAVLAPGTFRTIVTSPPYFGLRAYDIPLTIWDAAPDCTHAWAPFTRKGIQGGTGAASQKLQSRKGAANFQIVPDTQQYKCLSCGGYSGHLGLEPTLPEYITHLADVFDLLGPLLTDDGTLWVNIGDSWAGSGRGPSGHNAGVPNQEDRQGFSDPGAYTPDGMKPKDLMGVPDLLAAELRKRGWYWRSRIIWVKPNAIPGSYKDRPTHCYEDILLFSKSRTYFYNYANCLEPAVGGGLRQMRDVWVIPTEPTHQKHFAAFPRELARRCILLGSEPGDRVLDPFSGTGRMGQAALAARRSYVGVELSESSVAYSHENLRAITQRGVVIDLSNRRPRYPAAGAIQAHPTNVA